MRNHSVIFINPKEKNSTRSYFLPLKADLILEELHLLGKQTDNKKVFSL